MKVKIGKYTDWIGPYQIAEKLCFWVKDVPDEHGFPRKPDWVHKFGELLAYGRIKPEPEVGDITSLFDEERKMTLLYKFLVWIQRNQKRKEYIHIDHWDTWSMDHTLGLIALPMLKQLSETKQGAPDVDMEDVPEELRRSEEETEQYKNGKTDDNHFKRWDWIMNEMIFAFETNNGDLTEWEDQFQAGNMDIQWKKLEDGMSEMVHGPEHTSEIDWEGRRAFQARITNGFRLFGKYYENLWD